MMEAVAQMVVFTPQSAKGDALREYARYLSDLLGEQICFEPMLSKRGAGRFGLPLARGDLIVFGEPDQSWPDTLLTCRPCDQAIARSPASFLLARRPRWPIKSILLILRIEKTDEAAVDWLARLVQPGETAVTILPIVPSLPALYSQGTGVQAGLDVLLSPNTPSGRHLRSIAEQLKQWHIEGHIRLRQGEPDSQIWYEIVEGNYDLILIGAEPHGRLYRFLLGELLGPLLSWVDRPLLIARPSQLGTDKENGRSTAN